VSITDEVIDFILNWTKGHIYYVQFVCNKLYSLDLSEISIDSVKEVCKNILEEQEPYYLNNRNLLSNYQWQLLRAIGKEDSIKMITSKYFIKKHNLNTPSSIQTGIKALLNKELVFFENNEYSVQDIFLSKWLKVN